MQEAGEQTENLSMEHKAWLTAGMGSWGSTGPGSSQAKAGHFCPGE